MKQPRTGADPNFIFLLTGPSGSGKSSLLRPLLAEDPRLRFSVSCTTRAPRPGERDGVDYHFLDRATFEAQREAGAFVEWAEVHANLYGTRHRELEQMLEDGLIPVLDVDVQGGVNLLRHYGEEVVSIFLFPPSWEELERRLRSRETDDEETILRRLANARKELQAASHYHYWLVNDDLEAAGARLRAILAAEALVARRRVDPPLS